MSKAKDSDGLTIEQRRVERGEAARLLADNELLTDALKHLKEDAQTAFLQAKDPDSAWLAKQAFDAIETFSRELVGHILAGRDAMQMLRAEIDAQGKKPHEFDTDTYRQMATKAREEYAARHGEMQ